MSEISFVYTLLLFMMSSWPNLLRVALAPSLPSSGKKLKLNFERKKKEERKKEKKKKQEKNDTPIPLTYPLFLLQKISLFFFPVSFTILVIMEKIDLPSVSRK